MSDEGNLLREQWNNILQYMKSAWSITDETFNMFIKNLKFKDLNNDIITISINMENPDVNNDLTKNYIEKTYSNQLKLAIDVFFPNNNFQLAFTLSGGGVINNDEKAAVNISDDISSYTKKSNIYSKYTFETFISGDENLMVYNACMSVAEHPGERSMNPLFIYGNSGLGKTHLMHAIANKILEKDRNKNVLYVTSEIFTNEIIEAIRKNSRDNTSTKEFRNKYRSVDVLLIDDIQSIIGKEAVQTEFFNTFNELYDLQKQIVLSCDKRPKDLKILEERMSSRFLSGLSVDVKIPTYETRMAILKQKLEEENITGIDDSILEFIANNVASNIRELQGAMNKVISEIKFTNQNLTLEYVKESISDMITSNNKKNITIDDIIEAVCSIFDVQKDDLLSNKRTASITEPRHLCMYVAHNYTGLSLTVIGQKLGNRDHSTIINGENRVKEKLKDPSKNADFVNNYNQLINKLGINTMN